MTSLATAFVTIRPDTTGFGARLSKTVASDADRAGADAGKRMTGKFAGALKLGGVLAGAFAVTKGVSFFKDAIAEATEAGQVARQTAAVLKSTGNVAGISAGGVERLAMALSNKTAVDDEAIQSGANLLLTFKNVQNQAGKGNDIFSQATGIMVDMSAALGQDMKSSSIQLGKALNDPIKGVTALSRVGVSFTEGQKTTIKRLVETGRTMDAQKIILRELNSEFAGSAEAQATPAEKARVAWGNFKETIGTAVLPIVNRLATVVSERILPAMTKFFEEMRSGEGAGGRFAAIMRGLGSTIAAVAGFLIRNKAAVATFVGVLGGFLIFRQITAAVAAFNVVLAANPIGLAVVAVAALAAGLVYAYKNSSKFRAVVDTAFNGVKKVASAVVDWFKTSLIPFFTTKIPAGFQSVVSWVRQKWGALKDLLMAPVNGARDGFNALFGPGGKVRTIFSGVKDWATGTFKRAWAGLKLVFTDPLQAARNFFDNTLGRSGTLRNVLNGVKDWVNSTFKRAWAGLKLVFTDPMQAARNFFDNTLGRSGRLRDILNGVKDWALTTWKNAWAKVKGAFNDPVEAARKVFATLLGKDGRVRTVFNGVKDWAVGTFKNAWGKVAGVFTDPIVAVRKAFDRILGPDGPVRTLFSNTVKRIGDIWEGLQKKAKDPVRFVVNTVFAGMVRTLRNIPGLGGLPIPNVKFAQGGVMPGYTPGRDVHHFYSPTAGRLALSGGEAIMRPEFTRAAGGEKGIKRLNEQARRGIFHGGFAAGGIFRPVKGGSSSLNIHGSPPAIDIGVPVGQAVYAARGGRVTTSTDLRGREPRAPHGGLGYRSYGRYITINSGGIQTLYAHLSARSALAGQTVSGGQRIGFSGNTGNSRGPHLHFGASDGPVKYYGARPGSGGGDRRGGTPGGSGNPAGFYDVVRKYPNFRNPIPGILSSIGGWSKRLSGSGEWGKALAGVPGKLFGKISATGGFIFKKIQAALTAVKKVWRAVTGGGAGKSLNEVTGKLVPAMKRAYEFAQNTLGIRTIYGYSYRPNTADPSKLSDHAYGKALDLMGAKQNVADYFAFGEGRRRFNIENVIYNRRITNPGRGWRWGTYTGPNPHTDHVHIDTFDRGGVARGRGALAKNTVRPERVLSPRQTESFDRLVAVLERRGVAGASSPLIGSAVIRETVDLDRYEKQRAFRERMTNVGG